MQKYRAFVAVADAGSIAHAAERMGYSVSSVSRMISDLETSCGLRLFNRSKNGVVLTPDGSCLLARARAITADCDRFDDEAAALAGAEVGTVRIGTISSVATYILPDTLQQFRKEHPRVSCELLLGDYAEIASWLEEGRIDLGTVRAPCAPELETLLLASDEYKAVLPANHRFAKRKKFPIRAFADEPFIALEQHGFSEVAQILERSGTFLSPAFTVWDDYAAMAMVEAGLGLSIIPSVMLCRCMWNVVALPLDTPSRRDIALAWSRNRSLPAAASAFLQAFRDEEPHLLRNASHSRHNQRTRGDRAG